MDLAELGRYVGWGGTIGAGLGVAYAVGLCGSHRLPCSFERGSLIEVVADSVIGFTIGLVAGTAVYVVKLAVER